MTRLIDSLKAKARELMLVFGIFIIMMQIILPTFFDILTGLMLLGVAWAASKVR